MTWREYIKNSDFRFKIMHFLKFIPGEIYVRFYYWCKFGRSINLKNPVTFMDKMNWLKFHNIHSEYTDYVDKIKVHKIIKEKLGEDICFPILGVYDRYEDIDFDDLPDRFVIKCNHDSHSVTIVKDKNEINHKKLKKFYNDRLKCNAFWAGREYPYKEVEPKIMIEEYMVPEEQIDIEDYKFYCFDGFVKSCMVCSDRNSGVCFDHFDENFTHLPIGQNNNLKNIVKKPNNYTEMWNLASKLSEGIDFVRIDLYLINNKIYFGEFTFFAGGGFDPLYPDEYELEYGKYINTDK